MTPTDPRLQAAIDAALVTVATTVIDACDRVVESLALSSMTSTSNKQKQAFNDAQYELRKKQPLFASTFQDAFRQRVAREMASGDAIGRKTETTDWASLTLVDDAEVEEQVAGDRIAQAIGHECEWELRELGGYMGSLMPPLRNAAGSQRPQVPRNPLGPDILGRALYRAIEAAADRDETRALIAREMSQTVARAMRECYTSIVADLQARGVKPAGLAVRMIRPTASTAASDPPPTASSGPTMPSPAQGMAAIASDQAHAAQAMPDAERASLLGRMFGVPVPGKGHPGESTAFGGLSTGALNTDFGTDGPYGDFPPIESTGNSALDVMAAHVGQDVQLMSLIRRLTDMASRPGALDTPGGSVTNDVRPSGPQPLSTRPGDSVRRTSLDTLRPAFAATSHAPTRAMTDGGSVPMAGLMAVNLIRAHRDELMQASTGTLDHMVIDVVGSLFDQILSDPKVPPQMARQIARLQLPVLRVALADVGFFASRKHPVRRFVNRIASLACAFDDFDDGPGQTFLGEVTQLVREIVAGDFDQIAVYEAKLAALESFIGQSNEAEVEQRGQAASLLGAKETELRLQQRYMQQLTAALAEVSTPDFIREFLAQVWSQAIMTASRRDGPQGALSQRYRMAARNLVTSVQPKGTPALRKAFLMQLPSLMKDLNAGMNLIGWPEIARKAFFAQLLPLHAESLKGQPPSELQQNLLVRQLDSILEVPLPLAEQLSRDDGLPVLTDEVVGQQFSSDEMARLGLVEEKSVDWNGLIDIDLGAELEAGAPTQPAPVDLELDFGDAAAPASLSDTVTTTIAAALDDASEPSSGSGLMDNLKLGFAYRMHMQGAWTKAKLSYVSPSRAFFVFTHGAHHQQTLSMTSRMLARMCETGRLRAFEHAYLIERATVRARRQLAELSVGAARH
ncbi:MAG: hypothetical protein JWQ11_4296 [Rhizobacter sp.]|nr:hypothetical protein [Rhizobacter sp.]